MRFWLIDLPAFIVDSTRWLLKWSLVALGAFIVLRLFLDRIRIWPLY